MGSLTASTIVIENLHSATYGKSPPTVDSIGPIRRMCHQSVRVTRGRGGGTRAGEVISPPFRAGVWNIDDIGRRIMDSAHHNRLLSRPRYRLDGSKRRPSRHGGPALQAGLAPHATTRLMVGGADLSRGTPPRARPPRSFGPVRSHRKSRDLRQTNLVRGVRISNFSVRPQAAISRRIRNQSVRKRTYRVAFCECSRLWFRFTGSLLAWA